MVMLQFSSNSSLNHSIVLDVGGDGWSIRNAEMMRSR